MPAHHLSPKTGAALFALRRKFSRGIAVWFSCVIGGLLCAALSFSLVWGVFCGASLFVAFLATPFNQFHGAHGAAVASAAQPWGFLVWFAAGVYCAWVNLAIQLRAENHASFVAGLRRRFSQSDFWWLAISTPRLVPPALTGSSTKALKAMAGLASRARTLCAPTLCDLLLGAPSYLLAVFACFGFPLYLAFAWLVGFFCSLWRFFHGVMPSSRQTTAASAVLGAGASATPSAIAQPRAAFSARLRARVSRSIDRLAMEGGEELARREQTLFLKEAASGQQSARKADGPKAGAISEEREDSCVSEQSAKPRRL